MTQWQLTAHARERMALRGISVDQVDAVLDRPSQTMPDPKRTGCRMYVGGGVVAVVDERTQDVITVGIDGATGNDWQSFAAPPAAPLSDDVVEPVPARTSRRAVRRPLARMRPATAAARNVLDGVHPLVAAEVRRVLSRRGLDFRAVRVLSPTDVRIAP
jgi:Domain of unknown function (DUF4258)